MSSFYSSADSTPMAIRSLSMGGPMFDSGDEDEYEKPVKSPTESIDIGKVANTAINKKKKSNTHKKTHRSNIYGEGSKSIINPTYSSLSIPRELRRSLTYEVCYSIFTSISGSEHPMQKLILKLPACKDPDEKQIVQFSDFFPNLSPEISEEIFNDLHEFCQLTFTKKKAIKNSGEKYLNELSIFFNKRKNLLPALKSIFGTIKEDDTREKNILTSVSYAFGLCALGKRNRTLITDFFDEVRVRKPEKDINLHEILANRNISALFFQKLAFFDSFKNTDPNFLMTAEAVKLHKKNTFLWPYHIQLFVDVLTGEE